MAYTKDNIRTVRQAYSEKRGNALRTARERLEEVHRKYPEVASIDAALAETGMRLVEAIRQGSQGISGRVAAIRQENERLQSDRADILSFYGLPADYTDVHYDCPLCQDTGYQGMAMCSCMKKALAREGFISAGIAGMVQDASFDTFSLSYYRAEEQPVMEKTRELCKDYAEGFGPGAGNLLLFGNTGLGKTHLTCAMAAIIIEKGYQVQYQSAPRLFADFEAEKFGREPAIPTSLYFDAELLMIDDLGAETPGNLNVNFLYNLINSRMVAGRPTVINTNLNAAGLRARYTDRIASRLLGEYRLVQFVGSDVRMQKLHF